MVPLSPLQFELVLPAYNEALSLPRLVARYHKAAMSAGFLPGQFQLVIVNNGSTDHSASVLNELQSANGEFLRSVSIQKNIGYGHGLWSGLSTTTAPVVGYSHADEQCAPEDVFVAVKKLREIGLIKTLVKGVRSGRNWKDRLVSRIFETVAQLRLRLDAYEINAQPKVFPRSLLNLLQAPPTNFAFDLYVVYQARKNGYRIESIPVLFPPRIHGASRWAATFFSRYKTILGMISYMGQLAKTEGKIAS